MIHPMLLQCETAAEAISLCRLLSTTVGLGRVTERWLESNHAGPLFSGVQFTLESLATEGPNHPMWDILRIAKEACAEEHGVIPWDNLVQTMIPEDRNQIFSRDPESFGSLIAEFDHEVLLESRRVAVTMWPLLALAANKESAPEGFEDQLIEDFNQSKVRQS